MRSNLRCTRRRSRRSRRSQARVSADVSHPRRSSEAAWLFALYVPSDRAIQGQTLRRIGLQRAGLASVRGRPAGAAPECGCRAIRDNTGRPALYDSRYSERTERAICGGSQRLVRSDRGRRSSIRHRLSRRQPMTMQTLDVVVLTRDLAAHGSGRAISAPSSSNTGRTRWASSSSRHPAGRKHW
jgi:hypothetical protein